MANLNLLDINVDTLFEQSSIGEIEAIHKKIQEVVESKKEDLRTMVGESYRELLQAADIMIAMEDSAQSLLNDVELIKVSCLKLNEQQLLGFKTDTDASIELKTRNATKQMNNYFSTMVQIKLLTSLPEMIWTQLDNEHFYAATELFIFSRHISTGLQLNSQDPLMQKLPIAKKQWEIIKPFHLTIKQQVLSALEREHLSAESTVDCLLALLQLDRCSVENVLSIFLNLRAAAYNTCLKTEGGRVKDRILASLRLLNESMDMVGKCFTDNGLFFAKLSELSDPTAPPSITRMDGEDLRFAYLLPDIINNFKPSFEVQALRKEAAAKSLEIFLNDTEAAAANQLKLLFDLVSQMNVIQEIKMEANQMKKQLNLSAVTMQFNLPPSYDFYELRYVPLINQRIRNIINDNWLQSLNGTFAAVESLIHQPQQEQDRLSIWQEFASDLPNSLDQALSENLKTKKLLMKSKGYSAGIIEIICKFDESLAEIIKETEVIMKEPTSKLEDKLALVDFMTQTAQEHLTDFITKIKNLPISTARRFNLLFIIRFCCALVELCPHLKICFCQGSSWRQTLGASLPATDKDEWQRICGLLEDEVFEMWRHLLSDLLEEYNCEKYLVAAKSNNIILQDFTNWETLILEQKDDQDATVQSSFRIPTQPRISLQCYFHALITALKEIVPETLPSRVLHLFNQKLLVNLLQHYASQLEADKENNISQNVALQLYFDLKFLQLSFDINREQKEQFSHLQSAYKEFIDPFDYELFSQQLMANVKRAVGRYNCLLGLLTPMAVQNSTAGGTAAASTQEKEPNVLSLSSSGATTLWFPLLPVVTNVKESTISSTASAVIESKKSASPEKSTPTRKAASSRKSDTKSKSGAASFFGAMSQDWFR